MHCSWSAFGCFIVRESGDFPLALLSNSTQRRLIPCATIQMVLQESRALQKDLHAMTCLLCELGKGIR